MINLVLQGQDDEPFPFSFSSSSSLLLHKIFLHLAISNYSFHLNLQCLKAQTIPSLQNNHLQQLHSTFSGDWIFGHPFIGSEDLYMLTAPARKLEILVQKNGKEDANQVLIFPVDVASFHFPPVRRGKGKMSHASSRCIHLLLWTTKILAHMQMYLCLHYQPHLF